MGPLPLHPAPGWREASFGFLLHARPMPTLATEPPCFQQAVSWPVLSLSPGRVLWVVWSHSEAREGAILRCGSLCLTQGNSHAIWFDSRADPASYQGGCAGSGPLSLGPRPENKHGEQRTCLVPYQDFSLSLRKYSLESSVWGKTRLGV